MAIIVPDTQRAYTAPSGCLPDLAGVWCWVGLSALDPTGASVVFYSAPLTEQPFELMTLKLASGQGAQVHGPLLCRAGIGWNGLDGGQALVWHKKKE